MVNKYYLNLTIPHFYYRFCTFIRDFSELKCKAEEGSFAQKFNSAQKIDCFCYFLGKAEEGGFVSNVTLKSDFRVNMVTLESTIQLYLFLNL